MFKCPEGAIDSQEEDYQRKVIRSFPKSEFLFRSFLKSNRRESLMVAFLSRAKSGWSDSLLGIKRGKAVKNFHIHCENYEFF